MPAKDRIKSDYIDTVSYYRQNFNYSNYTQQISTINKKRLVETLDGEDLIMLANKGDEYYIYFWIATCSHTSSDIMTLDSLAKTGMNVIIASLVRDYELANYKLENTIFSKYPIYSVEEQRYSNILLERKARIIKEACPECYDKYKDSIAGIQYLHIKDSRINPVF